MKHTNQVILIGYSGHGFVVCDTFLSQNMKIIGYCDKTEKEKNPYELTFLGKEDTLPVLDKIKRFGYFIGIGDNSIRQKIAIFLKTTTNKTALNAIHKNSSVSSTAILGSGVMVGNGAIINACSNIGNGVICNTQSVIEHECVIGEYSHIAPGAVLCGNVIVGKKSFVGARSIIKQGIKIGDNVVIGAGTVVLKDIPNNSKVVGNPQKYI